jgi:hypothetical protein
VGCHLLGDLQLAAILQISRDAGGAKGVAAYLGLDASLGSAARRRRSYAEATRRTAAGITVQLARATTRGAEEWPLSGPGGLCRGGYVLLQKAILTH